MPLTMKLICEKCGQQTPPDASAAFICSYECTFCRNCTEEMNFKCPNCSGELVKRPTRQKK